MKAVLCKSLEGPEKLTVEEIPDPKAAPGEVIVDVKSCALNFFDTLITRGKYQFKPDLPFSPGGEIAGTVAEVGAHVTGFKPGDRVAAYLRWGGAREKVPVAAEGTSLNSRKGQRCLSQRHLHHLWNGSAWSQGPWQSAAR
jgi:NADPH2:quinone reductase